jgi:hypothetical protein
VKYLLISSFFICGCLRAVAQFAPPAGQPGSTAIHADSSVFVGWASHCVVVRGYQDIGDTALGLATAGDPAFAIGKADGVGIVSLGDGGMATLTFDVPIANGPGPDFAVFENAFLDTFLELAFVEVSSDGLNFIRFPATSLTQVEIQVDGFGALDATKIHNLAGKYRVFYGTPFDLEDLRDASGLDLQHITHVRIVDVVGSVQPAFARYDADGRVINDPWNTPFPSSGFDLDAVGVINQAVLHADLVQQTDPEVRVWPHPANVHAQIILHNLENKRCNILLLDLSGREVWQIDLVPNSSNYAVSFGNANIPSGLYLLSINAGTFVNQQKLIYHE